MLKGIQGKGKREGGLGLSRLFPRPPDPTPPPLDEAACLQQALSTLHPQLQALDRLLPRAVAHEHVRPVLHRLVAFVWSLPASEAHHHARPFGLLTHSLEVAQQALLAFTQSSLWWAKAPDPALRHRMKDRWLLGTTLAGLLHDAGKAFDVTVEVHGVTWDPLTEPLLPFLLRVQRSTLPEPVITWQPGRGTQHEAAGALAALLLLTREDLQALTLPVARELLAFLGGAPDPANLFRQLLTKPPAQAGYEAADARSARQDLQAIPPPQPDVAALVVEALALLCRQGQLRVNRLPGHVFVLDDETLVTIPESLKPVRALLARRGLQVPEGAFLYSDLADRGYILGPAGRNVAQAVFRWQGKGPITLAVLRFPNPILWGAEPPEPFGGEVTLGPDREPPGEPGGRGCAYCGATNVPLELEHLVPRSRGGSDRAANRVWSCRACHEAKGDRLPEEWLEVLRQSPKARDTRRAEGLLKVLKPRQAEPAGREDLENDGGSSND